MPVLGGILALFCGLGIAAVRWALRPLRSLTDTARRVTAGDESARAPRSPLADPRTAQLIETFNEMLDALEVERRRRQDDAVWMVAAEERQRERVAAQLYAGPAQTLAGVLVRLRLLAKPTPTELSRSPDTPVGEVVAEVRAALEEVQALARRLRPPELAELGTGAAVQALARRMEDSSGRTVRVTGTVPEERLPPAARAALYRIVEECLLETESGAPTAPTTVDFNATPRALETIVRLPAGELEGGSGGAGGGFSGGAGVGLEGDRGSALSEIAPRWRVVAHRAELVGGRLEARRAPDGGLTIRVCLPLDDLPRSAPAAEPWTPPDLSGVPVGEV